MSGATGHDPWRWAVGLLTAVLLALGAYILKLESRVVALEVPGPRWSEEDHDRYATDIEVRIRRLERYHGIE